MTVFDSREALALGRAGVTKWDRLLAAVDNASAIEPERAHSIGDSLTYWRTTSAALSTDTMVGHRRYETVLVVLDGVCEVQLTPKSRLTLTDSYCDLPDREWFELTDPTVDDLITLTSGQILAVPIDHAWRVSPAPHAELLIVRLTVEGATFHNK